MYDKADDRFTAAFPCPRSEARSRVFLRPWRDDDRDSLRRLNADPQVMRFFPAPLSFEQSDGLLMRLMEHQRREGFGVWAAEVREEPDTAPRFAGLAGFMRLTAEVPFAVHSRHAPVEIGWRFLPRFWGKGLAFEAAVLCLDYAFRCLELDETVAFAPAVNTPSRRLMDRLGMKHDESGDFRRPALPEHHPLSPYTLYRISRESWLKRTAQNSPIK